MNLGFGLLQTDEEQSTEEYDSAEDECDTLDELCCQLSMINITVYYPKRC